MTAVTLVTRICSVNVAIDGSVVYRWTGRLLGRAHIVSAIDSLVVLLDVSVIYIAMDIPVALDVADIDVAIHHVAIDGHAFVAVVDVNVRDVNARTAALDPAPATPSMVENSMLVPVAVAIEPGADQESYSECNRRPPVRPAVVANIRIINRDVDVRRTVGHDADVIVFDEHLLLRGGVEIAYAVSHAAQALNRQHDIRRLVDVSLTKGNGPIHFVGHHRDDFGIVGHSLHAYVPRIVVNAVRSVGANPARCLVDIVDEGSRNQDLRKKRIRVKRNGGHKVIELFWGKRLVRVVVILQVKSCRGRLGSCFQERDVGKPKAEQKCKSSSHRWKVLLSGGTAHFSRVVVLDSNAELCLRKVRG